MMSRRNVETNTGNKRDYRRFIMIFTITVMIITIVIGSSYYLIKSDASERKNQSGYIGLIQETSIQAREETFQSVNVIEQEVETDYLSDFTTSYSGTNDTIGLKVERESDSIDEERHISQILSSLTTEEKVAQMFMITPEALTGVGPVTVAGDTTKQAYQKYPVGGIIYYEENIVSKDQWIEMTDNVLSLSIDTVGLPVFIGVDEEGGAVRRFSGRIEGVPDIPSMGSIGESGNPEKAYEVGTLIGKYLSDMNVNLNLAPDADINSNPSNPIIGERAFSDDPELTAGMVAAEVDGLHDAGLMCTIKHFPGHGDTAGDSHSGMVTSYKNKEELYQCELKPFISGIEAGADCVMVGHISLPNIIGDDTPASLSSIIITELLRNELGFNGIIITDAMNMGAISDIYDSAQAAKQSIDAGSDIILMPSDFKSAYNGILSAVNEGVIPIERIDQSCYRIIKAKQKIIDRYKAKGA